MNYTTARAEEIRDRAYRLAATVATARHDGQLTRRLVREECTEAHCTAQEANILLYATIDQLRHLMTTAADVIDVLADRPGFFDTLLQDTVLTNETAAIKGDTPK
jgi:hypothetical protein